MFCRSTVPTFNLYISKVIHDILSGTTRSQKELWKPDLNLGSQGCHLEKNYTPWIRTLDPCICSKYFVTGPSKQMSKVFFHISILVPFWTTNDSFFPVTFTGLADLFPQLGSSHQELCGHAFYLAWWSNVKLLTTVAWVLGSNPGCEFWYFFMLTSLGD